MKKIALLIVFSCVLMTSAPVFSADVFDALNGLTIEQKRQISTIYNEYQTKNNELLMQILSYTDKIAKLKLNSDKTQEQIALISGVFEKNIAALKQQQQQLATDMEAIYKLILNDNQYRQYQIMQLKANESFNNFLQK